MGKKLLACILVLAAVCSVTVSAMPMETGRAETPSERMKNGLTAHWDFEGADRAEKLSDKATGGEVNDRLEEYYPGKGSAPSPIVLENGTASIAHDEGVYLAANNSEDFKNLTEYTVFTRLSMSGTPNAFMDFVFKNGFIRMYVNNKGDKGGGDYALEFRQNGSSQYVFHAPKEACVKANEPFSLAVTAKLDSEKNLTVCVYLSTDGVRFHSSGPVTFQNYGTGIIGAASSQGDNSPLVLGKATPNASDRRMDFCMDDVRFYNIALTAEEVSSLQPGSEKPQTEGELLAHWSFDELRGSTVKDSVGGRTASLEASELYTGISGNGVMLHAAENGNINFGERGITSILEGCKSYSVSLWILPSYYLGKQTSKLFTFGADESGSALVDVNWAKNNAVERRGISASVKTDRNEPTEYRSAEYTLPESVIPNLGYMGSDPSRTLGVWQLVTLTVDVENGTYQIFVNTDAVLKGTCKKGTAFSSGEGKRMADTVGFHPSQAGTMAFNGVVDELRIYKGIVNKDQLGDILLSEKDTTSPTADQKLVDALILRLGTAAVLYRGDSSVLLNGRTVKLDPADYQRKTVFKNRDQVYIPKEFAKAYFQTESVEADADGYVNLNSLCEQQGYRLSCHFSEKLAIILPEGVEDFKDGDAVFLGYTNLEYRHRMAAFFENPLCPQPTANAEQSRTVVYTSEEFEKYVYSPSVCTLNGKLYASCDIKSEYTLVFCSADGGETWKQIGKIDKLRCATVFAHEGQIYLMGLYINAAKDSIGICGTRSLTDEKAVFGAVSTVHCDFIEKSGHCSSTPMLFAKGRVYKAFEDNNIWAEEGSKFGSKKAFVLSCDLKDNLLNGSNWKVSNYVTVTADWVREQIGTTTNAHHGTPALEGNMVMAPDGQIYDILRLNCEPANGYAVRLALSDDGTELKFAEDHPTVRFPGGENKFNIRYDEKTGLYLALVNNNTDPRWPMQRNILSLTYSKDLINWEIAETVLVDRDLMNFDVSMAHHAFQYVDWCVDGEDIVFTVRETAGESEIFHNGYELTFYRMENYSQFLPVQDAPIQPDQPDRPEQPEQPEKPDRTALWVGIGIACAVAAAAIAATAVILIKKKKR